MSRKVKDIQPLVSPETMEKILATRRSVTPEDFYREVARHTGQPTRPARKLVVRNGQRLWVST